MANKVLFLNRKPETEFYNNERNKYAGVRATNIFRKIGPLGRILRKLIATFRLPGMGYFFNDWKYNIDDYDLFIISSSKYSLEIAKYIRKRSKKKIVHWYWNPVSTDINPDKIRGYSSDFYSFDEEDCRRYGLNYISTYYFSTIQLPTNKVINDIYFIGADKGRLNDLLALRKIFEQHGLRVAMHITKSVHSKKINDYAFQPTIPYTQALEGISKSRAILDYVQAGQTGISQRPMESLFFKKKLITNDTDICQYDFYNENNIFILGKDDINNLQEFINSPYAEIDQQIIEQYDFSNWLNKLR